MNRLAGLQPQRLPAMDLARRTDPKPTLAGSCRLR
jgi:hypothetical protein